MNFKPRSIQAYTTGFFMFLTVILILYVFTIFHYQSVSNNYSLMVDIAKRNSMLSQAIGFYSEILMNGKNNVKVNLISAINSHDKSLEILRQGGLAPGFNDEVEINSDLDAVSSSLTKAQQLWEKYRKNATYIANNIQQRDGYNDAEKLRASLAFIEQNGGSMLALNNKIVFEYESLYESNRKEFFNVLATLSSVVLLILALAFIFLKKNIINVLRNIGKIAGEILAGNFNNKLETHPDPNLNKISTAINDLGNNMNQAALFASNIGKGDFEFEFNTTLESNRLFHELVNMREQLKHVSEEDKKRNWASKGLAHFAEILRNEKGSIFELGDKIISECVTYLNANQGGLFIVSEEDNEEYMELLACYAWDRKKFVDKRINKGESLIGQCWIEKDLIYLSEVPDGFVEITSGLGKANPNEILIIPLIHNEVVLGTLEIASFNTFEKHQIEFLKKVCENIASALSSAKVMKETQNLLKKTQLQTEEMRAQEEEMRQNMEELQATEEEVKRQSIAHLQEIERLEKLHVDNTQRYKMLSLVADNTENSVIITDRNGLVEYVNKGFTKLTGYTLEDIEGKKPGSVLQGVDTEKNTVDRIREKINSKKPFYEEILNYDKYGKEYWISLSINPVFEKGELVNFVSVQANITDTKQKALDHESKLNAVDKNLAIIEFDLKGNIQFANHNFLKTMGYEIEEIRGKHHRMFMKKSELGEEYEQMWVDLANGKTVSGEFQRIDKSGNLVWLKSHYTPIIDITGKIYKIIKYAQNITASKTLALDFNSQMSAINTNNAVIEFNMDGTVITANENFLKTMGYTLDDIKGQHHKMFVFEEDINAGYHKMWERLNNGISFTDDFKRKSKNGDTVWLSSIYSPIIDSSGKPYKVVKYATDITQQKERTLDYKSQLDAIRKNYAVIEYDLKGYIKDVNSNYLNVLQYSKNEILGKHHSNFVFEEDLKNGYGEMWEGLKEGRSQAAKYKTKNKNGEAVWLNSIYTHVLDSKGTPYKIVKYAQILDN